MSLIPESATSTHAAWKSYVSSRDPRAREELLIEYLPLVRQIASRLIMSLPRSVRLDDLVSAGVRLALPLSGLTRAWHNQKHSL
jgi:DNA-directed RNA polymerase specialized sigma subunit